MERLWNILFRTIPFSVGIAIIASFVCIGAFFVSSLVPFIVAGMVCVLAVAYSALTVGFMAFIASRYPVSKDDEP